MKKLINIIRWRFAKSTCYANCSDIMGRKSGGVRDNNKVDWRAPNQSTS